MAQHTCPTCGSMMDHRKRFCSDDCKPRCSVEGCGQPVRKRGWCATHYAQWYVAGEATPFKFKWATVGSECVVCGEVVAAGTGRRKHCSAACQVVDSTNKGNRPDTFVCRSCGLVKSIKARDAKGRLRRTDTLYCRNCRSTPAALRFKKYGITPEWYATEAAKGCAVCGRTDRDLHVDHDHTCCPGMNTCGKCTRGLLCGQCNRGIGMLDDNISSLRNAIEYLELHSRE